MAKRKRVDDDAAATATDESSYDNLPLLAFHRHKQDMFVLSVADQILHKNPVRYGRVSPTTTLYWSTPQGWMLIMEHPQPHAPSAAYLWNPSTGDELPLPNVPAEINGMCLTCRCLLSHKDPSHPGCVVVVLCPFEPAIWYCHIAAAAGSRRWRRCAYEITNSFGLPARIGISVVASCRGKLYFIKLGGESMGVIDFVPSTTSADNNNGDLHPVFQDFDVPGIKFPHGMSSGNYWLVESHDQLFLVCTFLAGDVGAVHAYRMDFSARAWRRVRDIGDAVLFLESYSYLAASCAASRLGLKPNQIYFINNYYRDDSACSLST